LTPEQNLTAVRQQMALDENLALMIRNAAKAYADDVLRKSYTTDDAAALIRQAGIAEGIEKFARTITSPPVAPRKVARPTAR